MAKIETGAANVVRVIYPVQENPKLTDTVVIGDPETGIINCTTLGHTKQLYAGTIAQKDTGFVTSHDVAEALGSKADSSAVNASLDAKVDKVAGAGLMTDEERAKLAAIEAGANAYTLPVATAETLGGIKVGDNLTINAEGILSAISEASGVGEIYPDSTGGEIFNSYADSGSYYKRNVASGSYSHAEGNNTQASGPYSHAEGNSTQANSGCAHAEGNSTQASGGFAHAEGDTAKALGVASHAEGRKTTAADLCDHAEGINTIAQGQYSHAEGSGSQAYGLASHAEGTGSQSFGYGSHAEGNNTNAHGDYSHAEGSRTQAKGDVSHAEGSGSRAEGFASHAEGDTVADGKYTHSEGYLTLCNRDYAHSEGNESRAEGVCSHAGGNYTITNNFAQRSIGSFNLVDVSPVPTSFDVTKRAFVIGNGTDNDTRGDAFRVFFNGNVEADGTYTSPAADYAELFEWTDGNTDAEDRVGRFVSMQGAKIKLANADDSFILGVVSATPSIIGDNPLAWQGKYTNDQWGRQVYVEVETEYVDRENDKQITKKRIDRVRKLNPDYNPTQNYTPRLERPEWAAIGMVGKLLVRHDGTLRQGGFCLPGTNGIATLSENGYYVMEVIDAERAKIIVK